MGFRSLKILGVLWLRLSIIFDSETVNTTAVLTVLDGILINSIEPSVQRWKGIRIGTVVCVRDLHMFCVHISIPLGMYQSIEHSNSAITQTLVCKKVLVGSEIHVPHIWALVILSLVTRNTSDCSCVNK